MITFALAALSLAAADHHADHHAGADAADNEATITAAARPAGEDRYVVSGMLARAELPSPTRDQLLARLRIEAEAACGGDFTVEQEVPVSTEMEVEFEAEDAGAVAQALDDLRAESVPLSPWLVVRCD